MDNNIIGLISGISTQIVNNSVTEINQTINQITTKSWTSRTLYLIDELIINNSNLYRCKIENSDVTFTETNWELIGGSGGSGTNLTPEQETLINSISNKQDTTDENLTTPIKQIIPSINYLNSTLETAKSDILTKANVNNVVGNSTFNNHINSVNPHQTNFVNLNDVQVDTLLDKQPIVWDATIGKFKNSNSNAISDEKVKLTSSSENADYIENLIDSVTLQISNNKIVSKSLDGLTVGIQELNYLNGLDENLMTKLSNFMNGGITVYNGTFSTYADLLSFNFTSLEIDKTYIMYVASDEQHSNNGTTYLCNSTTNNTTQLPSYSGLSSASQRNLSVDKVNLATEVVGILSKTNMDLSGMATSGDLSSYMLSSDYTGIGTTPVNVAKTLEGLSSTVVNIDNSVANAHSHPNIINLNKFTEDESGKPLYNGEPIGNSSTSEDTMLMSIYDPNSDGSVLMADKLSSEATAPIGTIYSKNNSGIVGWNLYPVNPPITSSIIPREVENMSQNVPVTIDFTESVPNLNVLVQCYEKINGASTIETTSDFTNTLITNKTDNIDISVDGLKNKDLYLYSLSNVDNSYGYTIKQTDEININDFAYVNNII